VLSDTFPSVIDISSIGEVHDPLAEHVSSMESKNEGTHFLSERINPIDNYEPPRSLDINTSLRDTLPIDNDTVNPVQTEPIEQTWASNSEFKGIRPSSAFINQCVEEIDRIVESTPQLLISQPDEAIIVENRSLVFVSPLPNNDTPDHLKVEHSLDPQSLRIDAQPYDPAPIPYGLPLEQPQPSIFDVNSNNLQPLNPRVIPRNPSVPAYNLPPLPVQLVPNGIASAQPQTPVPSMISPIAKPSRTAQLPSSSSALIPSQLMTDFERHMQQIGTAGLQESRTNPPSRFCHVCVRPAARFGFLMCMNIAVGTCRKVVCRRCFADYSWDWYAAANDAFWVCSHCSGTCPSPRASCFTYNKSNKRRNPRKYSGSQNKRSRKI